MIISVIWYLYIGVFVPTAMVPCRRFLASLAAPLPSVFFSYYAFGGQSSTNGTNDALRAVPACATDGIIYPLLSLQARFKRHLLLVRALPSRCQRCMYVNDKALSLTDNKNSCVEKLGHVMHTNYPLRLYHVPFHKLTVKKTC